MTKFKPNMAGITMVELLLTISIISIMSLVIMNFMVNWIQQHAITEARTALLSDAQNAIDQMADSIRLSSSADQNNRWPDEHAPSSPANNFSWASSGSTLVLATAVENTSGDIVFSDPSSYTSEKDNLIYYINNGSLFRRVLAAPTPDNKRKTSCPAEAASISCPKDWRLAENVSSFNVRYFNADNTEVDPTDARSVELSITLQKRRFSQLIQSVHKTRMVFRND